MSESRKDSTKRDIPTEYIRLRKARPGLPYKRMPFKKRLREQAEDIAIDAVNLLGFMVILAFGEKLVRVLLGGTLAFDRIPISWVFDAGDIGLIFCYVKRTGQRLLGEDND